MDWFNQNKFRNWLIVILLVFNLITISTIWMLTANKNEFTARVQDNHPAESVNLMQKALGLNDSQTEQFEKLHAGRTSEMRRFNDSLDVLKMRMAEELFKENPDTAAANLMSISIGELESKLESIRFNHFRELMRICTSEQKEKLKPIIIELFGRKPPHDEPPRAKQHDDKTLKYNPPDRIDKETGGRHNPPSAEEKLARYSDKLNLTNDQKVKVLSVFQKTMNKDEELRSRVNPEPGEIENEKEKIRKDEDESIIKILNEDQRSKFNNMILNRKK